MDSDDNMQHPSSVLEGNDPATGDSLTGNESSGHLIPNYSKYVVIGLRVYNVSDIPSVLQDCRQTSFQYIVADGILCEEFVQSKLNGTEYPKDEPFAWFDMDVPVSDWTANIVATLRNFDEELETGDPIIMQRAREIMQLEFRYAQHLGLPCVVYELKKQNCTNLTQIINSQLTAGVVPGVWLKIPFVLDSEYQDMGDVSNGNSNSHSAWNMWNNFRILCNYTQKLSIALELPVDLPEQNILDRWYGEPVKALFISSKCFVANGKGYPVLLKKHQIVVSRFMDIGAQIIINCDAGKDPKPKDHFWHKEYIGYIHGREFEHWDPYTDETGNRVTNGYEDALQVPLQPLQDNLESHTYDVFEKDPVKYDLYQEAIEKALIDKIPNDQKYLKTAVLMVVGAGRGPLVRKSFKAAEKVDRKIRVYAIEKNFNAVNTLLCLRKTEWRNEDITVISSDMREWDAPEKADIIISELLGSFGDNELSPECLDGAQKFLSPNGIMIPQSYKSYVSPTMSSKLWNEVRALRDTMQQQKSYIGANFETPYVVHIRNGYEIAEPKQLFRFDHPKLDINNTNDRVGVVSFTASQDSVLHGFSGYFESKLYGSVIMSILPKTFSKNMFSWFPIFLPLRNPIRIRQGDTITAHFWRYSNKKDVWYEWTVSSPEHTHVHNPNGRSYTIGL